MPAQLKSPFARGSVHASTTRVTLRYDRAEAAPDVTVDPELVEAGNEVVRAGLNESLSGWVNEALAAQAVRDRRRRALSTAIGEYEAQFGEITAEEMAAQRRGDAATAIVVSGRRRTAPGPPDALGEA